MTIIRLSSYIPKNDIKIKTKYMMEKMYDIFNIYINDLVDDNQKRVISNFYKLFKENVEKRNFWYEISSNKFCCYEYTDRNNKNIARTCEKRINLKYDENDPNRIYCAEHNREHRRNKYKIIKNNIKNGCNIICKDGNKCKYNAKINGVCVDHYKKIHNINNVKVIHNIIEELNNEINILGNIEIKQTNCCKFKKIMKNSKKYIYNKVNNIIPIVEKINIKKKDELIENNINHKLCNQQFIKDEEINKTNKKIKILKIDNKCKNYECNNIKSINIVERIYCKDHEQKNFNNYIKKQIYNRYIENVSMKLHQQNQTTLYLF